MRNTDLRTSRIVFKAFFSLRYSRIWIRDISFNLSDSTKRRKDMKDKSTSLGVFLSLINPKNVNKSVIVPKVIHLSVGII